MIASKSRANHFFDGRYLIILGGVNNESHPRDDPQHNDQQSTHQKDDIRNLSNWRQGREPWLRQKKRLIAQ
jgi:hypothetical protein